MNSKDYEVLEFLLRAIEKLELTLVKIARKEERVICLFDVLSEIRNAKEIATKSDKALIQEFENEIMKLTERKATTKNYSKLIELYLHFGMQVNMSRATLDYSDEEYNRFLKLLEIEDVRSFLFNLSDEKKAAIDIKNLHVILEMGIVEKKNDKIVLTERGKHLMTALKLLQLISEIRKIKGKKKD